MYGNQFLLANIDAGTQQIAPTFTVGSTTIGTFSKCWYAVIPRTWTVNNIPAFCGEAMPVTVLSNGTFGTCTYGTSILSWTPQANVGTYTIYKGTYGTVNSVAGTYMYGYAIVNGTLGTWSDPGQNTMGTGNAMGSYDMAWTQAVWITNPDSCVPSFANNMIAQSLFNFNTVISQRKKIYSANMAFTAVGSQDKSDLMTAFNWQANMRFFPNATVHPSIYFDTYWSNAFNFQLTVPSNVNGGYNGNITLTGITGLKNITEIF